MKVKRKKLDIVFSNLVRERANYICQACCTNKRNEKATLDCAHIMSRRSLSLRYHPNNAVALCRSCHMFYTEHPFDWNDWCQDQLGGDFIAELRLVSNQTVKWTAALKEEIYIFYKGELKRIEEERKNSSLIIEFKQHEVMHKFA